MNDPRILKDAIMTSPEEDSVFRVVAEVASSFPGVRAKVSGGWVRDKLMGRESGSDIDMMVEGMPADEFAKAVAIKLGVGEHLIRENPEKSKHVRTARLNLRTPPISIDFAMARAETYAEDSRIPFVSSGTSEQDSLRRDFTVNALFWVVPAGPVEDFCGGLDDLQAKILRSPIEPVKMFMDDPLRVLRAARFASKLGFMIVPELCKAMGMPDVMSALRSKVSKERVGEEFVKIASGPAPDIAFNILKETGVFGALLSDALEGSPVGMLASLDMDQGVPGRHGLNLWMHSLQTAASASMMSNRDPEVVIAALFHDFGKAVHGIRIDGDGKSSYIGHELPSADIVRLFMDHVKAGGNGRSERIASLVRLHMRPHFLHSSGSSGMRRFVRKAAGEGVSWKDVFTVAEADFVSRGDVDSGPNLFSQTRTRVDLAEAAVSRDRFGRPKPVLDGNEIMDILEVGPGTWMSQIISTLMEWQDAEPGMPKKVAAGRLKTAFRHVTDVHRRP